MGASVDDVVAGVAKAYNSEFCVSESVDGTPANDFSPKMIPRIVSA